MIFNIKSSFDAAAGNTARVRQNCGVSGAAHKFVTESDNKLTNGKLILGALLLIVFAPPLAAQVITPPHDIDSIREAAHQFVKIELSKQSKTGEIKVGRLDSRLQLPRCSSELEVFFPNHGRKIGNLSVGVRCKGIKTWTIYVPVRVGVLDKVVVVSHALPRGHVILASDIQLETRDLASLSGGYLLNPRDVIGQSLRRPVVIGAVITPAAIKPARAIRRGEKVTILARRKGIEVRMTGVALADGAPGELVRVRNILSKKIIQGIVTKHGEVMVRI
ncbi:MAG: flagellar basal body P-ring formation chaperone FlgA [Acidiferrobacterales bacterium]